MFYVYILQCSDKSYYIGHTDNLEKRLAQHAQGMSDCYTKSRRPVLLVYSAEVASRYEALCAEQKIKKWNRRKKEALIRGDWDELRQLCKRKKKQEVSYD